MKITKDNIFEEAKKGNIEVLGSDLVDKIKDNEGNTPLHILAEERGRVGDRIEIIEDTSCGKKYFLILNISKV